MWKKIKNFLKTILLIWIVISAAPRLFWGLANPNNVGIQYLDYPEVSKLPLEIGNKLSFHPIAYIELQYARLLLSQKTPLFDRVMKALYDKTGDCARCAGFDWYKDHGAFNPNTSNVLIKTIKGHPNSTSAIEAKYLLSRVLKARGDREWSNQLCNEIITTHPDAPHVALCKDLVGKKY